MIPSAPPRPVSRRRRRLLRAAVGLLVLVAFAFGLLNWAAYRHARAFTHYAPPGAPQDSTSVPRPTNHITPGSVGLAFTSHKLDMGGGEFVAAWQIDRPGARGAVVLGPGHGSAKSSMLVEAAAFHRLGWAVFLVDFRGTGDSSGNTTTLGAREGIDFAAVVWKVGVLYPDRPVVGYGVSTGAAAILKAARRHLTTPLTGVVLESPFDELLESVRVRVRAAEWPAWPTAELLVYWGGRQHQIDGFAHRPADDAGFVDCPTRVLHGSADPWATPEMAASVFEAIPGPKQLVTFDGAGHEPLIRFDPAKWETAMAGLLADVERVYVAPVRRAWFGPDGEQPDPIEVMLRMPRRKN